MAEAKEVKKEIIEAVGVISSNSNGWRTELNLISWNDGPTKYDIRQWNEDHTEELYKLKDVLIQKLGR